MEFDHPPGDAALRSRTRGVASSDSISFVEDGTFDAHVDDEHWQLRPGTLFVTRRGMPFSCRHADAVPTDRCLTVLYSERAVEDLMRADLPAVPPAVSLACLRAVNTCVTVCARACRASRFGSSFWPARCSSRWRGESAVGAGATWMATSRRSCVASIARCSSSRRITRVRLRSAISRRRRVSSTFYFARAFQRFVGVPPHRYLTGVRLRQAARMLDEGAGVTFTCYEVGFGSLSHFVTAFRKRFGVVPSAARRGAHVQSLRAGLSRHRGRLATKRVAQMAGGNNDGAEEDETA